MVTSFHWIRVWAFALALQAGAGFTLPAAPATNDPAWLTLDRIFEAHEFGGEGAGAVHWSKRGPGYFSWEAAQGGGRGRDLVRREVTTTNFQVVIPASAFIPPGSTQALAVEAFEFSDDESKLLIFTNSKRVWRRNTRGDYWVLEVTSRTLRKLGGPAAPATMMFAKFSPDAARVAYVHENNLYVQDLRTLRIKELTTSGSATVINGTSDWVNEEELDIRDAFRWSPDGRAIAFWQFDTSGVPIFHMVNNNEGNYPRVTSFPYPKVGETNSAVRAGVVSASGGPVRWLKLPDDPRNHYLAQLEWTPDSRQLLAQQFNRPQNTNRVMLANPKTGAVRPLMTETDTAWLENENPLRWVGKDGRFVWLSERDGWQQAYLAGVDGRPATRITSGNFDVTEIERLDDQNGWLYFMASPENPTQRYLYRARLEGGSMERLSPANQPGWHSYNISPDAAWAVHTYSTFTNPPVTEFIRLPGHEVVRVLADNQKLREKIAALKRPESEFLRVDIGNGLELDAWCLKPPGFNPGKKYPLLIHVYGEPHGQTVRDAWPGSSGMWHWMLAQQGYLVASVENRGTMVPRGRDWRKAVHRQVGILAPKDQADAVRALLQRWPYADARRVGTWGWSGGGSMSLNAILRHPDIYLTAMAVAPVADQRLYDTIYQERYMGLLQENADGYREGSPVTHAKNLKGNLLIVHGTGDDNCHYQATEKLMNALIKENKQFTAMAYPGRSHGISEGANTTRHLYGLLTDYLHDNLMEPRPVINGDREVSYLQGWEVRVSRRLMAEQREATAKALGLLEKQLAEIIAKVPRAAVAELQKVALWVSPEYPGTGARAEYHPGAGWLKDHGRDPAMAKGVEFTNVRIFEAETRRMPNFALHELAHAYHDRVLPGGFAHAEIKAAYEKAKAGGTYDRVERRDAEGRRQLDRAYAMTDPQEYFAETTEAFFSTNDFFPYTRKELQEHDPEMFALLGKLWGETTSRKTAPPVQQAAVDFNHPPRQYVTNALQGWPIWAEKQLLDEAPDLAKQAMARVEKKLGEAAAALPATALPDLRKLRIFLMYGPQAKDGGRDNGLEYFRPKVSEHYRWLDPRMNSSIVIYCADNYVKLSEFWSLKALVHELGHAQHLEHAPEERADIYDTWERALKAGLYQAVRPEDKDSFHPNYAAQNHLEYLAELTAMYFVGANYFPKDRAGLKAYDPAGFALVEKVWGINETQ